MKTFKFELVSPERLFFSEDVAQVDIPGSEGQFGVLAGHAPFISTILPGVLGVDSTAGNAQYYVRGGFADVSPDGVTVLADKAFPLDELKGELLAAEIAHAEADVAKAITDEARAIAGLTLGRLKALIGASAAGAAH